MTSTVGSVSNFQGDVSVLRLLWLLVTVSLLVDDSAGITYSCGAGPYFVVNCSYTSVPRSQIIAQLGPISSITQLQLFYNQIATVDNATDFVGFPLQTLNMDKNLLTAIPDLGCVASTLQNLALSYNAITAVNSTRLATLVALKTLLLSGNKLTYFPDIQLPALVELRIDYNFFTALPSLPLIGRSLNSLYANGNRLKSLDTSVLYTYRNLTYFNIVSLSNTVQTFPNFLTLPTSSSTFITFNIRYNPWLCDCRLRWLRLLYPTMLNDNATCAAPSSLAGQHITDIPLAKFTCTAAAAKSASANIHLASANTYSTNPPTVARYAVPSLAACAARCLATTDCSQFNFGSRTDCLSSDANVYYCDVTGTVSDVTSPTSAGGANWNVYLFD